MSHHANDLTGIEKLIKIQTWHVERFAAFLKKIAAIRDGDGTLRGSQHLARAEPTPLANLHLTILDKMMRAGYVNVRIAVESAAAYRVLSVCIVLGRSIN